MSTEKYKCSFIGCEAETTIPLVDNYGNYYCALHYQELLKAINESKSQEKELPKNKKILHG